MATGADYSIGNCDFVTIAALTLQADDSSRHLHTGIVCLPGQRLLLADFSQNDIRLYNRQTGDILAKSKELYPLWDICSVDENKSKVAVTLRNDPQGMCLDLNQEQIFITLWGKNQISTLRLVWRGHAETAQSTDVPVRTRDGRTPAVQYRETLRSNRSTHDREIFTQADKSTSKASTIWCFGCFGTRVSKHKKKPEEQYNKSLDKDENRLAHLTWKDQEITTQSDNDSQTQSLDIGDPSLHDVLIEAREPVSLDVDAKPGLENNETAQGAKDEIVETPKERPCQRTQESSDSETDSASDDSVSSEASNDSPVNIKLGKTKIVRTGKNSETAIMSTNSGIVSIGGSSNSKIIQLNFVEKTNKKKRKEKKSRSYHYE
ncbi:hypothetical protein CHS0354_004700 [Potamilus streckersoni]|uniref:Uncharacterized protein n=1 Tax=Potamilus streckersoni TaxID=2493646 RepID=A0AAE0T1U5_9BIVA|nr:hypothetical protein CHS0354_004700 [Potamilus streckersoni]